MGHGDDAPIIYRLSYNDIHKAIQTTAPRIMSEFSPDLFIAIGGGGFIPARVLRTFCKLTVDGKKRNIPIQAVGLVLYESVGGIAETMGTEVQRTQWIDFSTLGNKYSHGGLLGRRILIVDEVDDTRTTLLYTVRELKSDIEKQLQDVADEAERARLRAETKLGIFVVQNKLKPKAGDLPDDVAYFAAAETPDWWISFPWEMSDIDSHDALRTENPTL
ncbi:hypothetical protein Q5752_000547 [Cryptotrichosporon argae]